MVWGQVDSFGVVFLLLGLRELWRDQPERSAIFAVVAALIKPQLGILVPIVAAGHDPAGAVAGPSRPDDDATADRRDSPRRRAGSLGSAPGSGGPTSPIRILTTGLAGFATAVVLCLPFGLSVLELESTAPYFTSGLLDADLRDRRRAIRT